MISQIELSIVIPAYNEEDLIEESLDTLDSIIKDKHLPYEIVVVNDGSSDRTLTSAMRYAEKNGRVKVISYTKNIGKGHAVKTGFMQSIGAVVIFADSDLEIDLSTISRYLEALKNGDLVIASKTHPDSRVEVPLIRKVLSYSFNNIVRLLTGLPIKDTQSGLKAMKKSAFEDIFPQMAVKRYAFDVELLAVANLHGLKIVELPVKLKLNASFKAKQIWLMFLDLLGIAYRLRVIHWYQRQKPAKNSFQKLVSYIFRD